MMEAFDFSRAEVLTEAGHTVPLEASSINSILLREAQIRSLRHRLEFAAESYEVAGITAEIEELHNEIRALEDELSQPARHELARLRTPSGGV